MKNYKLLPKITLWTLLAAGVAFVILFFFGGSNGSLEVAGDFLDIPRFSDAFLFWNYFLVILVTLITLCVVCIEFADSWKHDRSKAYKELAVVAGFIILGCVCWFLGSPEKIDIIGYEGTDNQGFWAQLADAVIYACAILVVATLGALVWGLIYTKRLSK